MKKLKNLPALRLSLYLSFAELLLLSVWITGLVLYFQPNSIRDVLSIFRSQPLLIPLNTFPIIFLVLCSSCLLGNVALGAAVINLFACTLSIANRLKIELRDEPVFPRDASLLRETASAISDYHIQFPKLLIFYMLVSTVLMCGIGCVLKNRSPLPPSMNGIHRRNTWLLRLFGVVMSTGILVGTIFTIYASTDLYNSFSVTNSSYIPSVFNELGFPYCFCHQFTTYQIDKPEGYSATEAAQWETGTVSGLGTDIHVIIVMNESFSDITESSVFAFTEENDPLQNFHSLQERNNVLSGHIVVSGYGAGTANTEFDVLTGIQTVALSETTTSAFRVVNRNLESLFRIFSADGYQTSFFHPGYSWFYNRRNVYSWFGAENTLFIDNMENVQYKGSYVTDDYMASLIEAEFEASVANGNLLFHYTTTIQNHQAYTISKYGDNYEYSDIPLTVDISQESRSVLEVYIEGLRDADAMLGRLATYFDNTEEPVLLVFYGDHLPSMTDVFQELGLSDYVPGQSTDVFTAYEVPYLIYANESAANLLDWSSLDLEPGNTISSGYLGAVILELTGRGEESPWFSFLNQVRREISVAQWGSYLLSDGSTTTSLTEHQVSLIRRWQCWGYYKLTSGRISD